MPVLKNAAANFAKAGLSLIPGAGPFAGPAVDLLVDGIDAIADIQDQQLTLLTSINENVQRLVDSPWKAARERIRFAALPGRSDEERRNLLLEARSKLFDAEAVQPDFSMARAEIRLDLALISASLGDGPGTHYSFTAAVKSAWQAALTIRFVHMGGRWVNLVPVEESRSNGAVASAIRRIRRRSPTYEKAIEKDTLGFPITDREVAILQIASQWLELGMGSVEGFADEMAFVARTGTFARGGVWSTPPERFQDVLFPSGANRRGEILLPMRAARQIADELVEVIAETALAESRIRKIPLDELSTHLSLSGVQPLAGEHGLTHIADFMITQELRDAITNDALRAIQGRSRDLGRRKAQEAFGLPVKPQADKKEEIPSFDRWSVPTLLNMSSSDSDLEDVVVLARGSIEGYKSPVPLPSSWPNPQSSSPPAEGQSESERRVMDQLINIVAEQLRISGEEIDPESHFVEDLGADSLDLVEIRLAAEEEFGIEVDESDLAGVQTMQQAVNFIIERTRQR